MGEAWRSALAQLPAATLWQADGSHPTAEGKYLAACVLYAAVFKQTPVGLNYRGDLSDANAALLQQTAASTVLSNSRKWGLS